jgi:hypothetical protein
MSVEKIILYSQSGQRPGEGNASGPNFLGHGGNFKVEVTYVEGALLHHKVKIHPFHKFPEFRKSKILSIGVQENYLVPILFEQSRSVKKVYWWQGLGLVYGLAPLHPAYAEPPLAIRQTRRND